MTDYDIIVIGTGAGTKLIRPAAKKGFRVAVIEEDRLGGTCLNYGCIPSKMLIHTADVIQEINESHRFNINGDHDISVDFNALIKRVQNEINKNSESIAPLYDRTDNITLYRGHATFVSSNEVRINDKIIRGTTIVIAVGADAHIPNLNGLKQTPYLTYKEALYLDKQPKSMMIIGGGYIATELGYFYQSIGTDVTFLIRSQPLRHEDHTIQKHFVNQFKLAHRCYTESSITNIRYDNKFSTTFLTNDKKELTIKSDSLLVATGVKANTVTLGLENTAVELDEQGCIVVDEHMKTSEQHIYAIGDCVGRHLFRHNANFEGQYLFEHLFEGNTFPICYPPMPHAVFTNPQIAGVGFTEQALKAMNIEYYVGINEYKDSAMGMALRSEHGIVKLLFDKQSHILLGGHIVGKEAATMSHMIIAYIQMKATLYDMLDTIYIHPALPENIRNAARNAFTKR
jgi:mycothione reductase